ncbi:hypothetical protein VOLCADRAFT_89968 [Volvox carteri f. nagariensis]|uniref:Uncharacterized protein n=1 Tax=Volvox carteri f. nagariensis TaxID=3068 RepID=D8TT50_VOLCA|nr:uncharacterized protein VOLCADRAFT_89968 [Volvox carteri f. nagariensis]EFJ49250.1 hypothetical protein VOLCADRAFT_89968 [Volvox carteri f. nagariensis]|eukprot:XP_002949698.1 hypothetical protein VOLCADRAFT_89968 [Volvox carteri f. nagariensis]
MQNAKMDGLAHWRVVKAEVGKKMVVVVAQYAERDAHRRFDVARKRRLGMLPAALALAAAAAVMSTGSSCWRTSLRVLREHEGWLSRRVWTSSHRSARRPLEK